MSVLYTDTVKTVFKRRIPWWAQLSKQPFLSFSTPKSELSSLKIFFNDGGNIFEFLGTEKLNPCACPTP